MIKIIKEGKKPEPVKVVCSTCGCEFTYEPEDIRGVSNTNVWQMGYVICPTCGRQIAVGACEQHPEATLKDDTKSGPVNKPARNVVTDPEAHKEIKTDAKNNGGKRYSTNGCCPYCGSNQYAIMHHFSTSLYCPSMYKEGKVEHTDLNRGENHCMCSECGKEFIIPDIKGE